MKSNEGFDAEGAVILFDSTTYHKISKVKELLSSQDISAVLGVPYKPDLAFVQFFNNFAKFKRRATLKLGKVYSIQTFTKNKLLNR